MQSESSQNSVIENDLVLIHIDDTPTFFARVEDFTPDEKPNWWRVKLLVLQHPVMQATWILRREQINGEPFTMSGTPIRIEKVIPPPEDASSPEESPLQDEQPEAPPKKPESPKQARILSLGDHDQT